MFGAGVGDVLADVPAVGVDGFGGLPARGPVVKGLGRVLTVSSPMPLMLPRALASASGGGAAVVVAHLDEDEVAGLHFGEDVVPEALVEVGAGAAAGAGAIGDVDSGGVEVVGEVVAPAEVGLVAGGGVADDEEGGESGVEWGVLRGVGLGRSCWRGWAWRVIASGSRSRRARRG